MRKQLSFIGSFIRLLRCRHTAVRCRRWRHPHKSGKSTWALSSARSETVRTAANGTAKSWHTWATRRPPSPPPAHRASCRVSACFQRWLSAPLTKRSPLTNQARCTRLRAPKAARLSATQPPDWLGQQGGPSAQHRQSVSVAANWLPVARDLIAREQGRGIHVVLHELVGTTTSPTATPVTHPPATPVNSTRRRQSASSAVAVVVAAATLPIRDSTSTTGCPADGRTRSAGRHTAGSQVFVRHQVQALRMASSWHGGHDPYARCGVSTVCRDQIQRVLLCKRPIWWAMFYSGGVAARRPRALLVAQFAAQDFAHRGLWQLGAELDHLGLLVAGEVGGNRHAPASVSAGLS
jgi:hypothetical protein